MILDLEYIKYSNLQNVNPDGEDDPVIESPNIILEIAFSNDLSEILVRQEVANIIEIY